MKNVFFNALIIFLALSINAHANRSPNGPYSSNSENYPSDWKGRSFHCIKFGKKYDWIPEFTLAPLSNPSESEFEELCNCIDKNTKMPWVKETGRKLQNNQDVSFMHKRGFPSRFGGKMRLCAENK
jgi:hypothetical protein